MGVGIGENMKQVSALCPPESIYSPGNKAHCFAQSQTDRSVSPTSGETRIDVGAWSHPWLISR